MTGACALFSDQRACSGFRSSAWLVAAFAYAHTGLSPADLEAAEREVNKRRRSEQPFTTLVAGASAGGSVLSQRRLWQLLDGDGDDPLAQQAAVNNEEAEQLGGGSFGGVGGRQRRTMHTFQRCAVPHSAGGEMLRFESLSLLAAGASLGFIYWRKRQAALRIAVR